MLVLQRAGDDVSPVNWSTERHLRAARLKSHESRPRRSFHRYREAG